MLFLPLTHQFVVTCFPFDALHLLLSSDSSPRDIYREQFLIQAVTQEKTCVKTEISSSQSTDQAHALNRSEVHTLLRVAGQSSHGLGKYNYAILQIILQASTLEIILQEN